MTNFTRKKRRTRWLVYWAKTGTDSFGNATVAQPIEFQVYAEKVKQETIDPQSKIIGYDYLIQVDRDLVEGSVIWFGRLDDVPVAFSQDLFEVIQVENYVNRRGTKFDRWIKAMRYSNTLPSFT